LRLVADFLAAGFFAVDVFAMTFSLKGRGLIY
jgi:hypothetical protein